MQHAALRTDEDSIVIFNCKDTEVGAGKQKLLRWLDWNFLGGYLLSLSINYVATSKDMGKKITTTVLCKDENFF